MGCKAFFITKIPPADFAQTTQRSIKVSLRKFALSSEPTSKSFLYLMYK